MNILQHTEQHFNFKYPSQYHQMYLDDMLTYGQPYGQRDEGWLQRMLTQPPLFFFAEDFELLPPERVKERQEDFFNPDNYKKADPALRFIPFGETGGGDLYCFYLNGQQGQDIPIALVWHDANRAQILAKNLQDFVFLTLLEAVTDLEEGMGLMDDDFDKNRQHFLDTHARYLSERQQQIVKEVYSRELLQDESVLPNGRKEYSTGLLTGKELKELLIREIGFNTLNTTITYQLP